MTADPTALAEAPLPCTCMCRLSTAPANQQHAMHCAVRDRERIAIALRTHAETAARDARRKAFEEAARRVEGMALAAMIIADLDNDPVLVASCRERERTLDQAVKAIRALGLDN